MNPDFKKNKNKLNWYHHTLESSFIDDLCHTSSLSLLCIWSFSNIESDQFYYSCLLVHKHPSKTWNNAGDFDGLSVYSIIFTIGTVMSKICIIIVRKAKFSCSKPHVVNLSSVLRTVFIVIWQMILVLTKEKHPVSMKAHLLSFCPCFRCRSCQHLFIRNWTI